MVIKFNEATYKNPLNGLPHLAEVEDIYFDLDDYTLVLEAGDSTYVTPMPEEEYKNLAKCLFEIIRANSGVADLCHISNFLVFPVFEDYDNDDEYSDAYNAYCRAIKELSGKND